MTSNFGAQFVAIQAGMYAAGNSSDGNGILFHNNYWAGLVLAIMASAIYTLGGLYFRFIDDPVFTCLVTAIVLLFNFGQYASCIEAVKRYRLKHKVRASVCSLLIALLTFVPALYFIFNDAHVYEYIGFERVLVGYDITMLIILAVLAVIGVLSVIDPIGSLCYIRHKCKVWGKRSVK